MAVQNVVQLSTVANLMYCELRRSNIEVAEDPGLRDELLYHAAEHLLYGIGQNIDLNDLVYNIKMYIRDTVNNYPKYFTTGQHK